MIVHTSILDVFVAHQAKGVVLVEKGPNFDMAPTPIDEHFDPLQPPIHSCILKQYNATKIIIID